MAEPTTHQESVLSVFRGVAHNLSAQSEKAAAREHELNETIPQAEKARDELLAQIAALDAQAKQVVSELAAMVKERDEVTAARKALSQQGAYAYSVIGLAEKASLTETLTDGSLDVSGQVDGLNPEATP